MCILTERVVGPSKGRMGRFGFRSRPGASPAVSTRGERSVSFSSTETHGDGELVLRTIRGDERAFGLLVQKYQRAAYSVAYSVTGRHEDSEDAAQEAFLVALKRLDECRDPERFAGWFMTIVRNRARNLVRREVLRETDQVPLSASTGMPAPDKVAEAGDLKKALREALSGLTEVQRQVVLLHDLEGWKHREIADRIGLPSGTVRSHLHFARKALREVLEGREVIEERRRSQ